MLRTVDGCQRPSLALRHRSNKRVLRKKLGKMAGLPNDLIGKFNALAEKLGLDNGIFVVRAIWGLL